MVIVGLVVRSADSHRVLLRSDKLLAGHVVLQRASVRLFILGKFVDTPLQRLGGRCRLVPLRIERRLDSSYDSILILAFYFICVA